MVLAEGRGNGELDPSIDPVANAVALITVLQGGYAFSRASGSADAYAQAVGGVLRPRRCQPRTLGRQRILAEPGTC